MIKSINVQTLFVLLSFVNENLLLVRCYERRWIRRHRTRRAFWWTIFPNRCTASAGNRAGTFARAILRNRPRNWNVRCRNNEVCTQPSTLSATTTRVRGFACKEDEWTCADAAAVRLRILIPWCTVPFSTCPYKASRYIIQNSGEICGIVRRYLIKALARYHKTLRIK